MKLISYGMTRQIGRAILVAKKNSPHLFFAGGLIGSVTSTVLACRATMKLEPVLDDMKSELQAVKDRKELMATNVDPAGMTVVEYGDREYAHDLTRAYVKGAKQLVKLYGPSVALNVASIGSLTGSHVQLARRNSALTATAAAISKAYDDYRQRVREQIGEKDELDIHRALVTEEVTIDGKKQTIQVADPNKWSAYARIFDESSPNWQKDSELNRIFVQCQQNYANHLLHARGHVFLNEVYDALGLERSRAGAVVGWVLDGDTSDNYIDFGLFEAYSAPFVNNIERSVILDFNVDGVIYDKI
jgi:hypothetical protein